MKQLNKAYLQLHLAVLLWGFTAIFGKLITLDALHLVIYRMFISTIALWFFLKSMKRFHLPDKKTIYKVIGIGIIVALHWITLYAAIKVSNVSVAISCFSSLALFTALFDHTNGTAPGYSERLNGSTNEKFGLAKSLSVMAGDTLRLQV